MARYTSIRRKKGQIWSIDIIIAVVMFTLALFTVFQYLTNEENQKISRVEELTRDSQIISESLLSEGVPSDWDEANVKNLGLTLEGRIDESKWMAFSQMDYYRAKRILNTDYEFYIYLEGAGTQLIKINGIEGIGMPGVSYADLNAINSKRIVKINRLTIYDSKIIKMVLYIWE